jgi:hypothetical protein
MSATFPKIDVCLICEAIRPELGSKATLMGFFGIAPDVNIVIPSLPAQITLAFLMMCGTGDGSKHDGKIAVLAPDGTQIALAAIPLLQIPPASPANSRGAIVASFPSLPIASGGKYTLKLSVDDRPFYSTSFRVEASDSMYQAVFNKERTQP